MPAARYAAPLREEWTPTQIRALRASLCLTQEEFALNIGINRPQIAQWELGRQRPSGPCRRLLSLIAQSTGFDKSRVREPDDD